MIGVLLLLTSLLLQPAGPGAAAAAGGAPGAGVLVLQLCTVAFSGGAFWAVIRLVFKAGELVKTVEDVQVAVAPIPSLMGSVVALQTHMTAVEKQVDGIDRLGCRNYRGECGEG